MKRDKIERLVSVVIPTYNQQAFVEETIESVLAQTYERVQIIVTDDGSIDKTPEIIRDFAEKFPKIIVPVFSSVNTGIAKNLNRGLEHVRGEYIAWLGGDDLMLPSKVAEQVNILMKRHDAVGCCHDAEVFESESARTLGLFSELYNGKRNFREGGVELLFDTNYNLLPSTVMIRSTAIPERGFDDRLRFANDWLFDIEVFRRGRCVPINKVLGKYRRHARNVSGSAQAKDANTEEVMIALGIIDARYPDLNRFVRKHRRVLTASASINSYRQGRPKEAAEYIKMLFGQGSWFLAPVLWVTLKTFGPFMAKQSELGRHQRSPFFSKLAKLVKRMI